MALRKLSLPDPFAPELVIDHLRQSSYGTVYRVEGMVARRLLRPATGPAVPVAFDFSTPGELRVEGPEWSAAAARHLFGLDDDLWDCYACLGGDPAMRPLLSRYWGLRLVRAPDLYEALVTAVLGQQVTVAVAQAQRHKLMAALGERHGDLLLYPRPEALVQAGPTYLQSLGISRQKSRYLVEVAMRAAARQLDPAGLGGLPDDAVLARLMEIPGVGRWTAEVALMRGLGRPDVLPGADVGLWNAVQRVYRREERPEETEVRQMGEAWRPWRSYAAFYLWASLTDPQLAVGFA